MWGGKNLDLGSKPAGRRDDVTVKPAPRASAGQGEVSVQPRQTKPFADDMTRADVQVLARYNGSGILTLVGAVVLVAIGVPVALVGLTAQIFADGVNAVGMTVASLACLVWISSMLGAVVRGVGNVIHRGRRALYIEEGRLIYVAPGLAGSFALTAAEIEGLEYKPNIEKFGPGIVLSTTRRVFSSRTIALSALDADPHVLSQQIIDFAALKVQG